MEGLNSNRWAKIFYTQDPLKFLHTTYEIKLVLREDYSSSGTLETVDGKGKVSLFPCCLGDSFLLSRSHNPPACARWIPWGSLQSPGPQSSCVPILRSCLRPPGTEDRHPSNAHTVSTNCWGGPWRAVDGTVVCLWLGLRSLLLYSFSS